MINAERRLRDVIRENKAGFWRIEDFGKDMKSVIIHPKLKTVDCYMGCTRVAIVRETKLSKRYALVAESLDL